MTNLLDRITQEEGKLGGKPCIRGMRIRVVDVLDMLAGGATRDEILRDYPYLDDQDISACLMFASKAISEPTNRPVAAE